MLVESVEGMFESRGSWVGLGAELLEKWAGGFPGVLRVFFNSWDSAWKCNRFSRNAIHAWAISIEWGPFWENTIPRSWTFGAWTRNTIKRELGTRDAEKILVQVGSGNWRRWRVFAVQLALLTASTWIHPISNIWPSGKVRWSHIPAL